MFIQQLERIIAKRKTSADAGSYTAALFAAGMPQIAQKIGEEAVETVIAALAQSRERQLSEMADLVYHLLVLMAQCEITLAEVDAELARRHDAQRAAD
jgi:phosphoribosyl-ATP pyrophosphohydrolase